MGRAFLSWIASAAAIVLLAGCTQVATQTNPSPTTPAASAAPIATNRPLTAGDSRAFADLAKVAPQSLKLEGGTVSSVACWTPSEHLFHDASIANNTTWKVLCRVYYDLAGVARYQDATCIGDFALTPMLNHCYVWEYYSYEPRFSDGDRLASPVPSPTP